MQEAIFAALLAAASSLLMGPYVIKLLTRLKFGQTVRDDGPKTHLTKAGTPTMGGILILVSILIGTMAFSLNAKEFVQPALLVTSAFGLVGFLDDFIKIRLKRSLGLKVYQKIIAQFGIALILALYAYNNPYIGSRIYLAFFGTDWDLGIYYVPFAMFVIISIVNSVNLIDGLDGLASGVSLIYSVSMMLIFMVLAGIAGQAGLVLYSSGLNGMKVFCAAVAGSLLGFLRFNAYPARVFMGDTGSLALGGAISVMALFSRTPILFLIMGLCYVATDLSVVLQVGSYKLRKKRIFKMAPLHHHFELLGYSETRIVTMYMIVTTILCLFCLLAFV